MYLIAINYTLELVQIYDNGRRYNAPLIEYDGEPSFYYKKEYHNVKDYKDEHTREIRL